MAANVAYGAPAKKAKVDGKVSPQTEEAPKTVSVVGPYGLLTSKTRGHLGCDAAKLREARIDMAACYRIMDELGLNEGIDNHLTVMPKASALCCLEDMEIKMIHQNSCRFLDEVAYDTVHEGPARQGEGDRLAEVMGSKRVLMHQSHGPITCGDSVAEAFDEIYYLERACEVQLLAMNTGSRR
ncbi:actin binding protein [Aureococcus anophagefferens]|uniref:Actin binding protein n=1 Tax=Aureococcus anophagefferens TaxID=44056 RepID=A0ABR1FH47_AURAN